MTRAQANKLKLGPKDLSHPQGNFGNFWQEVLAKRTSLSKERLTPAEFKFMAYCWENASHSRAQLFQDLFVAFKLGEKRRGFFVEFGATNGIDLSNTYYLEKTLGWRGVLAEPYPIWHQALRKNRKKAALDFRCVWTESGKEVEFLATAQPELATVKSHATSDHHGARRLKDARKIRVSTVSLNDLLKEHRVPRVFDYLSIDTEETEYLILKTLDFERYRPRIITVEHNFNPRHRTRIRALLEGQGYRRELESLSLWDDWYVSP